jgi:CBS domain-containing protein
MVQARTYRPEYAEEPVNSLMTWPVTTVDADDCLADVSRALSGEEVGAVLVLRGGAVVGLVSERDIAGIVADGADPARLVAGDVMTRDLVTVPPEAPILEAARIMRGAHVRHLPVVADGVVAGIISIRDVFDFFVGVAERTARHPDPSPAPRVPVTVRRQERLVWLLTCPMCGRESHDPYHPAP